VILLKPSNPKAILLKRRFFRQMFDCRNVGLIIRTMGFITRVVHLLIILVKGRTVLVNATTEHVLPPKMFVHIGIPCRQVFGAPPLLSQKAIQGELDAVLNYWPYAARLEAKGFKELIGLEDVVEELGAKGEVSMVGFVFSDDWAEDNPRAIRGFLQAADEANELLATSDEAWERLRPMMDAEDEATFEALRRRFREGIPERSPEQNEADAKVLYQFLRELGGERLVGPSEQLAPGTFWNGSGS